MHNLTEEQFRYYIGNGPSVGVRAETTITATDDTGTHELTYWPASGYYVVDDEPYQAEPHLSEEDVEELLIQHIIDQGEL